MIRHLFAAMLAAVVTCGCTTAGADKLSFERDKLAYVRFTIVREHSESETSKFLAGLRNGEDFKGSNWIYADIQTAGGGQPAIFPALIRMNAQFRRSPKLEGAIYLRDGFVEVEEWDLVSNNLCYSDPAKLERLAVNERTVAKLLDGCPRTIPKGRFRS